MPGPGGLPRDRAAALRSLRARAPRDALELERWNREAVEVLRAWGGTLDEVAIHYLNDADVRWKDAAYRKAQEAEFDAWLARIEAQPAG